MLKLLLLVLVVVVVVYLLRSGRLGGGSPGPTRFQAVDQLPEHARRSIDADLDADRLVSALKTYREATGAGPAEAKAAVETYRWKRGGATS